MGTNTLTRVDADDLMGHISLVVILLFRFRFGLRISELETSCDLQVWQAAVQESVQLSCQHPVRWGGCPALVP